MPRERRACAVDGCERRHYCKGYCPLHYQRWRAHGDPLCLKRGQDEQGIRPCLLPGCDEIPPLRGKGPRSRWCGNAHYQQWRAQRLVRVRQTFIRGDDERGTE